MCRVVRGLVGLGRPPGLARGKAAGALNAAYLDGAEAGGVADVPLVPPVFGGSDDRSVASGDGVGYGGGELGEFLQGHDSMIIRSSTIEYHPFGG